VTVQHLGCSLWDNGSPKHQTPTVNGNLSQRIQTSVLTTHQFLLSATWINLQCCDVRRVEELQAPMFVICHADVSGPCERLDHKSAPELCQLIRETTTQ